MPFDIPQISFVGGEMSPHVFSRIDLQKFGSGAAKLRNYFVHAEGGTSTRAGTTFVHEIKDNANQSRLIKFEYNEQQAYALEFGNQYIRLISNGGLVLEPTKTITATSQTNPVTITSAAHGFSDGDEVFISGVLGMVELNNQFFKVSGVTANSFNLAIIDGTNFSAYVSGGTVARVYEIVTPYLSAELSTLKFRQSNDVLYLTHRNHAPRKLNRNGATDWALEVIGFAPLQVAPTGVSVTVVGAGGSTRHEYLVTAVAAETLEESITVSAVTTVGNATLSNTNYNRVTWAAAAVAERYNVYKEDNGLYGYIGSTETTTFNDKNILVDLDDTAPKLRQPFATAGNYPGAVGLHEQRTTWGNTDNGPLNIWLSQTSQFENMNVSSPLKATDAVSMRLVAGKGNEVRHFRSFDDKLFIFTSGAVWTLEPGGDSDAITPASKQLTVQEWLASTEVPPITIKKNMLMVSGQDDEGFEVHSVGEDSQSGIAGRYAGSDLTVLSRHLFEGYTIKEWCYMERPYRLVLAIRSDGKILCLTYLNEHQVYAWSVFETDGIFESICDVPEGQEDTAYIQVKRTINGQEKRYIERFHSRTFADITDAFFVDCGLSYTGPATAVLGGLDHLEGKSLIALVDGNLEKNLLVTNGTVNLQSAGSKIHIGLSYQGQIDTLPLDVNQGESMAKKKSVSALACRVLNTRGLYAGPQNGAMEEVAARTDEKWGAPANTISDMRRIPIASDWERSKGVSISSEPGLPSTILSIVAEVNVGGN